MSDDAEDQRRSRPDPEYVAILRSSSSMPTLIIRLLHVVQKCAEPSDDGDEVQESLSLQPSWPRFQPLLVGLHSGQEQLPIVDAHVTS